MKHINPYRNEFYKGYVAAAAIEEALQLIPSRWNCSIIHEMEDSEILYGIKLLAQEVTDQGHSILALETIEKLVYKNAKFIIENAREYAEI